MEIRGGVSGPVNRKAAEQKKFPIPSGVLNDTIPKEKNGPADLSKDPAGLAVCLKVPGLLFVPGTAAQIYGSYFFFLSSSFSSLNTPFSLTSSRSSAIFRT